MRSVYTLFPAKLITSSLRRWSFERPFTARFATEDGNVSRRRVCSLEFTRLRTVALAPDVVPNLSWHRQVI